MSTPQHSCAQAPSGFHPVAGNLHDTVRDKAILAPNKVIVFLRAVEVRDKKDVGVLLEDTTTENDLTDTWENVWDIVARYTKRGAMSC